MTKNKQKYSTRKTTQSHSALKHNTAYYLTLHHTKLHSSPHLTSSIVVALCCSVSDTTTIQHTAVLYITIQYSTISCAHATPHHSKLNCITLDNKPHHIALQYPALRCAKNTWSSCTTRDQTTRIDKDISQHNTSYATMQCIVLHCTAMLCNATSS